MATGIDNIEHVVVVMMENRSFDNLLGWLYGPGNLPKHNIPEQNPTTFDGLLPGTFSNEMGDGTPPIFASRPPKSWPSNPSPSCVPTPDPHEEFDHITTQIFGTANPTPGQSADMSGFLKDYASTNASQASAGQIMESYGPQEANVINDLARNFAVCDAWFASCPCQTWPNRGFVHTGSSDGHINNDNYELYDIQTIFNVLEKQNITWNVFADTNPPIPSLTLGQFLPRLLPYSAHFRSFSSFPSLCTAQANANPASKLPAYSFIEPRFVTQLGLFKLDYPSDYHPPHDVCRGDVFLSQVYDAVRSSPYRDQILLVITFDEHGGCYDHVAPPTGAVPPLPYSTSRDGTFGFDRFGVRVPAIVISSYVRPGTVFRASGQTPYDHTSILATLRDWKRLDQNATQPFLPSPRIAAAPTLQPVLTQDDTSKIVDWPEIAAHCSITGEDESLNTPLNDVQRSLIASAIRKDNPQASEQATAAVAKQLTNYQHQLKFLHPDAP
jgi:phospholipase C